jgi:ferredoxin-NADP reductase/DMSO/TMAO reductase YedYZ heme-binding membrane subunit
MVISHFTRLVVILNCSVPAILLTWDAVNDDLAANPVNFAIRTTGILSLIFLVLSLTVTPVIGLFGLSWLGQFRRVFGLYAFFHAAIHFGIFFLFDRSANVLDTISEIAKRSYLLVGIVGLGIMVPLAVTSTNRMIRRLGPNRWKLLHRLAYFAAIAGALHFYLLVKADTTRPIVFASLFCGLFLYRMLAHYVRLRRDSYHYRTEGAPASTASRAKQWTGALRIARIFRETPEVSTFRLVMPDGIKLPFDHLPGQYLNLNLEIEGRKVRRSYTIASPPTRSGYCELTVKREQKGLVSRYLHNLREGSLLNISAPAGRFTFTGVESDQIVMLAGGVGITPLMAKIRYLTDLGWPGSIHLIFSVKSERDIIFRNELEELQKRFTNFKLTVTLTRDQSSNWRGERGRITPELLAKAVPDLKNSRIHLCGPTEMTEPLITMIRGLGVPPEMIKVESFASPSREAGNRNVPDVELQKRIVAPIGDDSTATLEFARSGKTASMLAGRTILEIAEEQGVAIPYDCRSAVCGQCKTTLLSGTVIMEAEDALDAKDRATGVILACQARCQGNVVIDA